MVSKSAAKYIRISPRKVRLVADLVRGKSVIEVEEILLGVNKRAKVPVYKAIKSAVANAAQKNIPIEALFVSKIVIEEGPTWKRYRAGTMGRAMPILKRTSHIKVELDVDYEMAKEIMQRFSAGAKAEDIEDKEPDTDAQSSVTDAASEDVTGETQDKEEEKE